MAVLAKVFGDPADWPEQDLIGFSHEFDAQLAVAAYCSGVFPMPLHDTGFEGEMGWWSPVQRGILPVDELILPRSLKKSAKRYVTTIDAAFDEVLDGCADPNREFGWIDEDIARVYRELHQRGVAHSVESWNGEGQLVGGLYGIAIGGLFAGESMFHDPVHGRDASKVALLRLVNTIDDGHPDRLVDVQWRTDHLASLGVSEVDRSTYLFLLERALDMGEVDWASAAAPLPGPELVERDRQRRHRSDRRSPDA